MKKIIKKIPGVRWLAVKIFGYKERYKKTQEFKKDFVLFSEKNDGRFSVVWKNRFPCLDDKTAITPFDAHYVYHPAWAARVVAKLKPAQHVDIASTLHFASIVSAYVPVRFYDYRPAPLTLSGLTSERADLMALPFADNSVESLSCMHTIEHIGLGRYGDPIDPTGDLKAIKELQRVTAIGGSLLFVVPIGQATILFNAHRIYSFAQIKNLFSGWELVEYALVDDAGKFTDGATEDATNQQKYGCGCFWFRKK